MEGFNIHELSAPLRNVVRPLIAKGLEESFASQGIDGFYKFNSEYLDTANVRPEFVKESDPRFAEWRRRLNEERGIMISNHPSIIDAPLLASALSRPDVKIVVNKKFYEQTEGMPIHELFIPALQDTVSEVKSVMKQMEEHIKSGGLVWIFPTGAVAKGDAEAEFASGLRHLISRLDDTDMVYSFHIDTQSLPRSTNTLTVNSGLIADFLTLPELNPNSYRDTAFARIDESCTNAKEWKNSMVGAGKPERNKALTQHYLELFGISGVEFIRKTD